MVEVRQQNGRAADSGQGTQGRDHPGIGPDRPEVLCGTAEEESQGGPGERRATKGTWLAQPSGPPRSGA